MPSPNRPRRGARAAQYTAPTYLATQRRLRANLRALRDAKGWTMEEAAAQCGMAFSLYHPIEAGTANITLTTVARIADGFGVEPHELIAPARKR